LLRLAVIAQHLDGRRPAQSNRDARVSKIRISSLQIVLGQAVEVGGRALAAVWPGVFYNFAALALYFLRMRSG
jgi:hypothetical protein